MSTRLDRYLRRSHAFTLPVTGEQTMLTLNPFYPETRAEIETEFLPREPEPPGCEWFGCNEIGTHLTDDGSHLCKAHWREEDEENAKEFIRQTNPRDFCDWKDEL